MRKKIILLTVTLLLLALTAGAVAACNGETEDKKIVSIEFADGEWQTNYYLGQLFEPCEATITYDDGTTEVITVTAEMIRGFDTSKIGEYDITIDINGFTKTLTITVGYPEEENVVPPQLYLWNSYYFEGETPSLFSAYVLDGINITYVTADMVEGFDTSAAGEYEAEINYKDTVFTAKYFVEPVPETEIEIRKGNVSDEVLIAAAKDILKVLGIETDKLTDPELNDIELDVLSLKPYLEMAGADDDLVRDLTGILTAPDNSLLKTFLEGIYSDNYESTMEMLINCLISEGNFETVYRLVSRVSEDLDASALANIFFGLLCAYNFDSSDISVWHYKENYYGFEANGSYAVDVSEAVKAFDGKEDVWERILQYYTVDAEYLIRSAGSRAMPAFEALEQFIKLFFAQNDDSAAEEMQAHIEVAYNALNMLNEEDAEAILDGDADISIKDIVETANYFGEKLSAAGEPFFDGEVQASLSYLIGFVFGEGAYLDEVSNLPELVVAIYKFVATALSDIDEDLVADLLYSYDAVYKNQDDESALKTEYGRLIATALNFGSGIWSQMTPTEQYVLQYGGIGIDRVSEYLSKWTVRDTDSMTDADFDALKTEFESYIMYDNTLSYNAQGKALFTGNASYSAGFAYLKRNATQAETEKIFWDNVSVSLSTYEENSEGTRFFDEDDLFYFFEENDIEYSITADTSQNGLTPITMTVGESYYIEREYDYETGTYTEKEQKIEASTITLYVYVLDEAEFADKGFAPLRPYGIGLQVYSVYELADAYRLTEDENFIDRALSQLPASLYSADGSIKINLPHYDPHDTNSLDAEIEILCAPTTSGITYADINYTLDGVVSFGLPAVFIQEPDDRIENYLYKELLIGYEYKISSAVQLSDLDKLYYLPMPETGTKMDEILAEISFSPQDLSLEDGTVKILQGYEPKFYLEAKTLTGSVAFGESADELPVECSGLDVNTPGIQTITLSYPEIPGMTKVYKVEVVSAKEMEIGLQLSIGNKLYLLSISGSLTEEGVISDPEEIYSYFEGGIGIKLVSELFNSNYPEYDADMANVVKVTGDSRLEDCTDEFLVYVGLNAQLAAPQVYYCVGTYSEIKDNLNKLLGITVEYDPEEWDTTFNGAIKQLTLTFKKGDEIINTQIVKYAVMRQLDASEYTLYEPNTDSTYSAGAYTSEFLRYSYIVTDGRTIYLSNCEISGYSADALGEVELTIAIPETGEYIVHTVTIVPDNGYVLAYGEITSIGQASENPFIEQDAEYPELLVSVSKAMTYNGELYTAKQKVNVLNSGSLKDSGLSASIVGFDKSRDYGEYTATITLTVIKTGTEFTIEQKYSITPPNMLLEAVEGLANGIDGYLRGAGENEYMAADLALVFKAENGTTGESINLDVEVSFAASFAGSADDWALFEITAAGRKLALYFVEYEGTERVLLGEYINGAYEWYLADTADEISGSFTDRIRTAVSEYCSGDTLLELEFGSGFSLETVLNLITTLDLLNAIPFFGAETENGFAVEFTDNALLINILIAIKSFIPSNGFETEIAQKLIGLLGIEYDETLGSFSDVADADLVIDFELNGAGALNGLVLEYGLTPKEGFEGWTISLALAVDNLVTVAPAAKPYEYEALNAEGQPVLKTELTLPMTDDPDDDVTLTYYTVIETGETLVNFEQYGKTEKFIYEQENQVIIDTFFLEYLFGMAAERNPDKKYLVNIYRRSGTAPMNAAGETGSFIESKTPEEIFAGITGAFGSDLKDVDSVADHIITWIFILEGEGAGDVSDYANIIKIMPMCYLYNALNALFDAAETGVFTAPELYIQGDQWEILPEDYTQDLDAPLSVDTFLAFFRTQGWNITDMEDSLFAQMTDQSLTYNAETGRYELQIDDALVTFDIELISYEEFEAA